MSIRMKSFLRYLSSLVLTLGFLYFAFRGTDFRSLWEILRDANYWWAIAMLPPLFISHIFRAWRWEYLLRPIKRGMRFRNLFSATIVGYMLNNVLPRAGEIGRPYAIGKLEGISRSAAFGTVMMERIFDVLSFLVVAALIPLVYSGPLKEALPWLESTGIWISALTLGCLAVVTFLMLRRDIVMNILAYFTRHLSERRAKFVEHITHSFLDGFLFLKEPRHYFMIALLSVLVWVFYIVMMYIPFFAFGLDRKYGLDLGSALVVQAISSIGFMLPTPGATGSYHYFVIQTMTKLYGVNEELARSYATVTHAVGYIGTTLLGIYYFMKDRLHIADVSRGGPSSEHLAGELSNAR